MQVDASAPRPKYSGCKANEWACQRREELSL